MRCSISGLMRRAARKDGNHNDVAGDIMAAGWSWHDTYQLGDGFVDGVAAKSYLNVLVEIKDGSRPPSARKLTEDEQKFHDNWPGLKIVAISGPDAVMQLSTIWRMWGRNNG